MRALLAFVAFACFAVDPVGAKTSSASHLVIVWHENAHDVWVGRGINAAEVEAALLKRCNRVMERGCSVARSASKGYVAIVRRADGSLGTAAGTTEQLASEDALKFCLKSGLYCDVEEVLAVPTKPSATTFRDPANKNLLMRRYGAIVWQQPASVPVRLWVASGRRTAALAIGDAVANCSADVGSGCVLAQGGANTTLVAYMDEKNLLRIIQGKNLEHAFKQQDRFCKENALSCTTKLVVDSTVEETSTHVVKR